MQNDRPSHLQSSLRRHTVFKYGLVTELLRETCKGGLILSILEACVPGNLNVCELIV